MKDATGTDFWIETGIMYRDEYTGDLVQHMERATTPTPMTETEAEKHFKANGYRVMRCGMVGA